jgi:hypothetical protein
MAAKHFLEEVKKILNVLSIFWVCQISSDARHINYATATDVLCRIEEISG